MAIVIVDYDEAWPATFAAIRARVARALHGVAVAVEHVGSTAVPGLAAKPIIDMTAVVASPNQVATASQRLEAIGYRHRGDLGVAGREAFRAPPDTPRHHLYVCARGSTALRNHLTVRDHLRAHPETARAYGELKHRLAAEFPDDIDAYVDGKTGFIIGILSAAGFSREVLTEIQAANRKA